MPNDNYANEPNNSRAEFIIQATLDGTEYDEPAQSRIEYLLKQLKELIAALRKAVVLRGETTTPITDNATTNPIMIDGKSYTAIMNDAVIYQSGEFIFDGTKWHELGDLSNLTAANIGAMTGYSKPNETSAIAIADTLNQAIGKLEKALDLKQSSLTEPQLAAVNSGITSTDVTQIGTNKNNISKQQDSTASGGNGYAIINGQRLYMGTAPMPERTGDIWLDGTTARESGYLLSANPFCGIGDYKDTLNLATGVCERNIKKLVLDGTESWSLSGSGETSYFGLHTGESQDNLCMSSHFEFNTVTSSTSIVGIRMSGVSQNIRIRPQNVSTMSVDDFKSWLAQEYANGTPVTVWYILATTATETITVPSGNVGTVEGYLIQDGTPTQSSPVYPTANEVLGWKQ